MRIKIGLWSLLAWWVTAICLTGCGQAGPSTSGDALTSVDASGPLMDLGGGGRVLPSSDGGSSVDTTVTSDAPVGPTPDTTAAPDTTAVEDTSTVCPDAPPEAADVPVCMVWECVEASAPTCWSCALVAAGDGEACTDPATGASGTCAEGGCETVPDPGEDGELPFLTSVHEVELDGGFFPVTATVTLYLPQAAGPFPVVVFHHGFELAVKLYDSIGEHLASRGYVAVLPQMPGGFIGGPTHAELKGHLITLLDWIEAEAEGAAGAFEGKADASTIGLAGHSLGGKISMLTATEDDRPLAIFGVDPVDAAGGPVAVSAADYPSVTPELMDQVTVPLGLLGETTNGTCEGPMCQACAPEEDNFQQYYEHATSPAIEIEVLGANHMSFLDDPDCGLFCSVCPAGTDDTATTRLLMRRYMTAFFNVFLRGQDAYRVYLTGAAMDDDVAAGLVVYEANSAF